MRPLAITLSALAFAAVGALLGFTIHGATLAALIPTVSGAAGGFGAALAALFVVDLAKRPRGGRNLTHARRPFLKVGSRRPLPEVRL